MKTLNLVQGSPEWDAFRAQCRTASEAPAMMGESPYMKRSELLRQKATGQTSDVSAVKQAIFNKGHAAEEAARPVAEKEIGAELFPVTGLDDDGQLSASFDGLTMDREVVWEHKLWNQAKAEEVAAGRVPTADYWQVVQQLYISGAKKALYMLSDADNNASCWLTAAHVDACGDFDRLLAGWQQFNADLDGYVPDESVEAVAQQIDALPTLAVELAGEVKNSNLATYKDVVSARVAAINTDLQTDQDFADAEQMVKFLDSGEKEIETVKKQALAQTASIDDLFRTLDHLSESMRKKRLELNKLVKARKDAIRIEIKNNAQEQVDHHIAQINETLGGKVTLPAITPNFAGVMKNKRTITSLKDACADEVARVKIEASEIGDRIRLNLELLRKEATGVEHLFRDVQQIVTKEPDDFANLVTLRINEHKAEQDRIAAEAARKERERIEREDAEKAQQSEAASHQSAPAGTIDPPPTYKAPTASEGGPTRASIVRLVADAYNLSDNAATALIQDLFVKQEAA